MKKFLQGDKALVKTLLLDTAVQEFGKWGYSKVSVEALAQLTGIAKGSFYSFYETKEELFEACCRKTQYAIDTDIVEKLLSLNLPLDEMIISLVKSANTLTEIYPLVSIARQEDLGMQVPSISVDRFYTYWERKGAVFSISREVFSQTLDIIIDLGNAERKRVGSVKSLRSSGLQDRTKGLKKIIECTALGLTTYAQAPKAAEV